jgi:hypothetical protein
MSYSVDPVDTSQYDSLPTRLPTPHSKSRPMLPARPNCMHVSWRLSTPSTRNVAHFPRRFLMSVASAPRFKPSCVLPGPNEPRWRQNSTVYARRSCTSSRKVRFTSHKKLHTHAFPQSRCATITASGHTADSRRQVWPVRFFFLPLLFTSLTGTLIRDDRQSHPSRVPCTNSRRRRGPRLHAHTLPRSSPHYVKNASASVQLVLRHCDASRNSKPSSRGARWSSRSGTRPRRRPPFCPSRATAPSAYCSSPPRGTRC